MKRDVFKTIGCRMQEIDNQQWRFTKSFTRGDFCNCLTYRIGKESFEMAQYQLLEELLKVVYDRGWDRFVIQTLQRQRSKRQEGFSQAIVSDTAQTSNGRGQQ
ncbi:MAG: hypothetical protein AAF310_03080 [Myxococcota bacterium]